MFQSEAPRTSSPWKLEDAPCRCKVKQACPCGQRVEDQLGFPSCDPQKRTNFNTSQNDGFTGISTPERFLEHRTVCRALVFFFFNVLTRGGGGLTLAWTLTGLSLGVHMRNPARSGTNFPPLRALSNHLIASAFDTPN